MFFIFQLKKKYKDEIIYKCVLFLIKLKTKLAFDFKMLTFFENSLVGYFFMLIYQLHNN